MRVELENNRTPLDEFVASLGALREPVELARNGEVVARLTAPLRAGRLKTQPIVISSPSKPTREYLKIEKKAWVSIKSARARVARKGIKAREIEALVNRAIGTERKKYAARDR